MEAVWTVIEVIAHVIRVIFCFISLSDTGPLDGAFLLRVGECYILMKRPSRREGP